MKRNSFRKAAAAISISAIAFLGVGAPAAFADPVTRTSVNSVNQETPPTPR